MTKLYHIYNGSQMAEAREYRERLDRAWRDRERQRVASFLLSLVAVVAFSLAVTFLLVLVLAA